MTQPHERVNRLMDMIKIHSTKLCCESAIRQEMLAEIREAIDNSSIE
jgi:hypothetical protein